MQADPVLEWRRLTEHYRQMNDGELRLLAADFSDLTETAQQALRGEFRSRGLGDPESARSAPEPRPAQMHPGRAPLALRNARCDGGTTADIPYEPFVGGTPELVPDTPETHDEAEGPHEYTWKTVLCECETTEQAQQLCDALQQAGIDNWIEHPGASSRYKGSALEYPRVLVAADQLDEARIIAAQPIPQDIIDDLKVEAPEFIAPKCPKCGAADPILIAANPANTWRCEQCDNEWTEPDGSGDNDACESDQTPP